MLDIGNVGSRETGKVPPRKLDNEVSLFQSNLTSKLSRVLAKRARRLERLVGRQLSYQATTN